MKDTKMDRLIENYTNGNLTAAKAQARRHSWEVLVLAFEDHGHNQKTAIAIADYLKGHGTFQAACDAEHTERASR